jgi:pyridoxal 5-phosphate dependent beta-lyase
MAAPLPLDGADRPATHHGRVHGNEPSGHAYSPTGDDTLTKETQPPGIRDKDEIPTAADTRRLAERWRDARPPAALTHLDTAACGRMSRSVIAAVADHLAAESERGGYVAEAEAEAALRAGRAALAELLTGAPGVLGPDDVVPHHSATAAFAALVAAWPLVPGALVGVIPGEYGSNAMALAAAAERAGATLVDLPTDPLGRIDLDALERHGVAHADGARIGLDALAFVTFPHIASHSGLPQPAAELAALAASAGTDLVLDVAQSLGHVDCSAIAASAWVGTSRKWLCGPRGVGFAAARPEVADRLRLEAPNLYTATWADADADAAGGGGAGGASQPGGPGRARGVRAWSAPRPAPGVRRIGIGESSPASRVGLARALAEARELADGLPAGTAFAAITAIGRLARARLDGVAGWRTVEPLDTPGAIVTLRPPPGVDPATVVRRLAREQAVLTTAIETVRAPRALDGPLLRVSPHLYTVAADVDRLADALERDRGDQPAQSAARVR